MLVDDGAAWLAGTARETRARPTMAVVLTSPWVTERVVNAKKICELVSSFARDGCALAMSSVVDADAATRIETNGYISRFRRSGRDDAALEGFGFWTVVHAVTRPREYYARKVSEKKRRGCTRMGTRDRDDRGAWGIWARSASWRASRARRGFRW